jgi:hypothetical protein
MVTPQDLQKWQQASLGIDKLQSEFSPEKLQAYQKILLLFKSESFHSIESIEYVKMLKDTMLHTKNRLLKAHLSNIVALSEKYFTAKAATGTPPVETFSATPPQNPPQVDPLSAFEIPTFDPPHPPKAEVPKVEQSKTAQKPKSKFGIILIIIIAILLIGGYSVYNYWDAIFPPKSEIVELSDTLDSENTDEIAELDSLTYNTTALPTDTVQFSNTATTSPSATAHNPAPPLPKQSSIQESQNSSAIPKKTLSDFEIITLFSDVSVGDDEAFERFIKEIGRNIKVEGVENIDNSYELAHDALLYDRNYSISIQRSSNGKISKIIVR